MHETAHTCVLKNVESRVGLWTLTLFLISSVNKMKCSSSFTGILSILYAWRRVKGSCHNTQISISQRDPIGKFCRHVAALGSQDKA